MKDRKIRFWEKVYCEFNGWRWWFFSFMKPKNWNELSGYERYKNKRHRLIIAIARSLTTHKGRSRAHWIRNLNRTHNAWSVWYNEKYEL